MSTLFGGNDKSHDIRDIVDRLTAGSAPICNESVAGTTVSATDICAMADDIKQAMTEHYSQYFPSSDGRYDNMLMEDAEGVAQMFKNSLADSKGTLSENATMPSLVTLTASIATTMRTPYEAVLHRMFDTRTIEKQTVDIEEVIATVKAPGDERDEDLVDALSPNAKVPFVDRTEIEVATLTNGLVPGADCKRLPLLDGMNPLFRINRDVRITRIEATVDGEVIPPENINLMKGSVPYFEAKNNTLNCMFEVKKADGTIVAADVTAKMDFDTSTMEYLRADDCVTKVYFYATVSHAEHTHPIHTSFRNSFEEYCVPTRPHIEVSLPQEMRTDISNSIHHFANTDIVTAMTENITVISSRMEDQRLKKCMDDAHMWEAEFSFEAPDNFAYGNLEWIRREFIPFLDQIALDMKNDWNITDCHFRVAVSPYILRILDTDYSMDKGMTEESKGSGVINYSIGCKTSTATFYFISSQFMNNSTLQINLMPNNFKNSQVKTYNYFKYSSFLTDQLRRADNHVQPAVVYSERNLPIVFTPLSAIVNITNMPIQKTDGPRWIKRVA